LINITLSELFHGLETRNFTSADLVKAYLNRINEVDHEFHSVIETNPDALETAHALDIERSTSGSRGPLHGIPILLKDNIVTLDRMDSTCGSYALVGAKPPKESAAVTALRKSGAVILGKTNMAQWAGFRSTSGCSGWSARGGQCTAPFYKGMKASGSSSGSAVATALGLGFAALGTETSYSVVSPAERAGVVGFKPTRGLIPSEGIIFASERQDTVGLLTRTVTDASKILQEIMRHSNEGNRDSRCGSRQRLKLSCLSTRLNGVRIGVPANIPDLKTVHPAKQQDFKEALCILETAGADIVQGVNVPGAEEFEALPLAAKNILLDTDIKLAINRYLSNLSTNPQNIGTLEDLIVFTKSHPKEAYPERNVAVLERALATSPNDGIYKETLAKNAWFAGDGGIEGTLKRHRLDLLLAPSLSSTLNSFAAKAGAPCMSIPMGKYPAGTEVTHDPGNGLVNVAPGIPFSLYIYGGAGDDTNVLNIGYVFEELAKIREELAIYLVPKIEIYKILDL
ncbi:amidase signature enzyme, partial [Karstenula rhodostoma CBS 690.94]